MKSKKQIFIIHGGMTFKSRAGYLSFLKKRPISLEKKNSWSGAYLDKKLDKDYDIIRPRFPLQDNANYDEWRIHFERFIPLLKPGVIFIGSSLGGIFLAKYLSENIYPKKIRGVFLVSPPFDGSDSEEELAGGFRLKSGLTLLEKNAKNLFLFFSKNDIVVPPSQAEKYRKKLKQANIFIYNNKNGHFKVTAFPEIVRLIRHL